MAKYVKIMAVNFTNIKNLYFSVDCDYNTTFLVMVPGQKNVGDDYVNK